MPPDEQALWTVSLQGGRAFSLDVAGNPPLEHTGGNTVVHMVISAKEATQIRGLGVLHGCATRVFGMAEQTPTQQTLRERLIGIPDRVWPAARCPDCPWLDPLQEENPCGLVSWPIESIETLRATFSYREGERLCPLLVAKGRH